MFTLKLSLLASIWWSLFNSRHGWLLNKCNNYWMLCDQRKHPNSKSNRSSKNTGAITYIMQNQDVKYANGVYTDIYCPAKLTATRRNCWRQRWMKINGSWTKHHLNVNAIRDTTFWSGSWKKCSILSQL